MTQKQQRPGGNRGAKQNKQPSHSNSNTAQQLRLHAALLQQLPPVTTLYAREHLDVLHPAARIQELREQGHNIITHWATQTNAQGHAHRVAQYVLMTNRENAA